MSVPEDQDLRERFASLRREDAAVAPPFDAVRASALSRPIPSPRLMRWAPAIALAAAALFIGLSLLPTRHTQQPLISLGTTSWQSPTDFLLHVPGAEYLETLPSVRSSAAMASARFLATLALSSPEPKPQLSEA